MKQITSQPILATFHLGGRVTLTPNWKDKNVIIPNCKLFYILDGEIVIKTEKQKFTAKKGDMVLIPAGVKHDFNLSQINYAEKYWFHFDLSIGSDGFFDNLELPYIITIGKSKRVNDLFDSVFKHATSILPQDKLRVSSSIIELVAFYLDNATYSQKVIEFTDEIDKAIAFIKEHLGENPSLKDIAKRANLSPNYFVRKFKDRTGYAPLQFVKIMKLEEAKYLIEQTHDPISQIMENLGFYDASYFSKLFKKYCGYSPKKFREISTNRNVKQIKKPH